MGRGRVEKQDPTPFANRLSVGKHTHTFLVATYGFSLSLGAGFRL